MTPRERAQFQKGERTNNYGQVRHCSVCVWSADLKPARRHRYDSRRLTQVLSPYIALQIPSQTKMRTPLRRRIAAMQHAANPINRKIDPAMMSAICPRSIARI